MTQRDMTIKEYEGFTNHIVDEEGNVVGILNFWMDEDVEQMAKDIEGGSTLTKYDISEILKFLESGHDAEIGINWDVIKTEIENYIGEIKTP